VRLKGLYEGVFKGFYRNSEELDLEMFSGECLGRESYEALNVIAKTYDDVVNHDDWTRDLMGMTALVRIFLDNQKYCQFDQMSMDLITFCFINKCDSYTLLGNFLQNWAEAFYAFNMIWTTIISAFFAEGTLENSYNFYYIIGQNVALLLDDIVGYRAKDEYDWSVNFDDEFAE
jgi:hypothetical protein